MLSKCFSTVLPWAMAKRCRALECPGDRLPARSLVVMVRPNLLTPADTWWPSTELSSDHMTHREAKELQTLHSDCLDLGKGA